MIVTLGCQLYNIDGTENHDGTIAEVAVLGMTIGDHQEQVVFMVTDVGDEDVIIGLDWLHQHNPEIDWERGSLRLSRCPSTCHASRKASEPAATVTLDTEVRLTVRSCSDGVWKAKKIGRVCAAMMVEEVRTLMSHHCQTRRSGMDLSKPFWMPGWRGIPERAGRA